MPNTEHLDPNYGREKHRSRRSSAIPSGLWLVLGALAALLIVLSVRGPATIVVQSDGGCCCCQSAPCKPAGAAKTSAAGDRIGWAPIPAPAQPGPGYAPKVSRHYHTPWVPLLPWGGGGGEPRDTPADPTPVPEPGSVALIVAGVAAWRLLA